MKRLKLCRAQQFLYDFYAELGCEYFRHDNILGMVFCYQNCSDLLWEKNCSTDQENLLKFEAESREFAKFLRSLEQFILTVGQNNFL